jgi:hypothetical protein
MNSTLSTTIPAVLQEHDVAINWHVGRADHETDISFWFGTVQLVQDTDSTPTVQPVGEVRAYAHPDATDRPSAAFDDFDSITGDLALVAGEILIKSPGFVEKVTADDDVFVPGLLVVDSIRFDPAVRGHGLLQLVLRDLTFHCRGIGLIALYSCAQDEEGPAGRAAQRRLAKHYALHGFSSIPRSGGVMVASPAKLRLA